MQLVQTDMQHSQEDNAVSNLQLCGSYMVLNHPSDTPAADQTYQYPDGSDMLPVYNDGQQECDSNHAGAVTWYGSFESGTGDAALTSIAGQVGQPVWDGQQALQDAVVAKKGALADVSRHDTPPSVFDIFNSLDISATPSCVPVTAHHQQHQHNTGRPTLHAVLLRIARGTTAKAV